MICYVYLRLFFFIATNTVLFTNHFDPGTMRWEFSIVSLLESIEQWTNRKLLKYGTKFHFLVYLCQNQPVYESCDPGAMGRVLSIVSLFENNRKIEEIMS